MRGHAHAHLLNWFCNICELHFHIFDNQATQLFCPYSLLSPNNKKETLQNQVSMYSSIINDIKISKPRQRKFGMNVTLYQSESHPLNMKAMGDMHMFPLIS